MDRQDPNEQLLEKAILAMRQAPALGDFPQEQLLKSIAASRDAAARQPHWIFQRIRAMKPLSKIAASIFLALGMIAAGWAVLNGRTALAFATVADQLHDAKTLTADLTIEMPRMTMHWKIMYLAPGHVRYDLGAGQFQVIDQPSGKIILRDERNKVATMVNVDRKDQQANTAFASFDWIERLRNLARDAGKPLGEADVDGVHAKKFAVQSNNQSITIFADANTGMPLRIESSTPVGDEHVTMTLDHIALGQPLDSSLFSMEIPAGYRQQHSNITVAPIGEADLVKFLEDYAQRNGVFAPSLRDVRKDTGIGAGTLPKGSAGVTPQFLEAVNQATRAILFIQTLPASADWHYAGTDIKKGDASKPIFWYHAKDAQTYRVLYADLHFAEVPAADVPTDSKAETQPSQ